LRQGSEDGWEAATIFQSKRNRYSDRQVLPPASHERFEQICEQFGDKSKNSKFAQDAMVVSTFEGRMILLKCIQDSENGKVRNTAVYQDLLRFSN